MRNFLVCLTMNAACAALVASPAATAQTAGTTETAGALAAPAQAKVAAPAASAPTVKAGEGGGRGGPGATPDYVSCIPNCTAEQIAARNAQVAATPMGRLMDHVRATAWPTQRAATVASGVNHTVIKLTAPDGRTFTQEQSPAAGIMTGIQGYQFLTGPDGTSPGNIATRIIAEGDNLRVYTAFSLTSGELITPPQIVVPATGGTRTIPLEGGGSLTVTIDGAHALTATEQASRDSVLQMTSGRTPQAGPPATP